MSRAPSLYFYVRSCTALRAVLEPHKTSVSDQLLACKAGSLEVFLSSERRPFTVHASINAKCASLHMSYAHRASNHFMFHTGAVRRLLHSRAPHASSSRTLWLREAATASATAKDLKASHNLPQKRARKKPFARAMAPEKRSALEVMTAHVGHVAADVILPSQSETISNARQLPRKGLI